MLRRTERRRRPSNTGEVSGEGEMVTSLSEISASWCSYLRRQE